MSLYIPLKLKITATVSCNNINSSCRYLTLKIRLHVSIMVLVLDSNCYADLDLHALVAWNYLSNYPSLFLTHVISITLSALPVIKYTSRFLYQRYDIISYIQGNSENFTLLYRVIEKNVGNINRVILENFRIYIRVISEKTVS